MKKTLWLLLLFPGIVSCEKEVDYSGPQRLEYLLSFVCESMPVSIVACPCNGDMVVLNRDPSTFDFSMKLSRYSKDGTFTGTLVDFADFDRGNHVRYLPNDIALDEFKNLYVLAQPVTDTSGGIWTTANGFNILVFDPEKGLVRELDFSAMDGARARNLAYSDGFLYTEFGPEMKRISLAAGEISGIPLPEKSGNEDWLFGYHSDMEIDAGGVVYFSGPYSSSPDSSGCRIETFNLQSRELHTQIAEGTSEVMASMVGAPGLAIHRDGDIFLANFYGGGVEIYGSNMNFLLEQELEKTGERNPLPIDLATYKNRVYVADYANNRVYLYSIRN